MRETAHGSLAMSLSRQQRVYVSRVVNIALFVSNFISSVAGASRNRLSQDEVEWPRYQGHTVDALALEVDEGRGQLR